jgi:hypothetical protein
MAGLSEFRLDDKIMKEIIHSSPERLEQFLDEEAEAVVNDIVLSFGSSPAAHNSPPGVDTGTLRASITWSRDGKLRRKVMDGVLYGVILELGSTRHPYRWPFMGPAFERERSAFADHAQNYGLVKE